MLRRAQVNHILRAAAAVTSHNRFVMIGTGAVIATATGPIPAGMMLTSEIDLFAEDVADPAEMSDLIDASIGQDSQFHRTFNYYGHGVGANTALLPLEWRSRAREYRGAGKDILAICPEAHDIAVSKLCAWRDKDRDWLRAGLNAGVLSTAQLERLLNGDMPAGAPDRLELANRLLLVTPALRR